jgi:hypothetical protein
MSWTADKPTEAGVYWYRDTKDMVPVIMEISSHAINCGWWIGTDNPSDLRKLTGEWQPVQGPME